MKKNWLQKKDHKMSRVFVNPYGVLCATVVLFDKPFFTLINVSCEFVGYDINSRIINNDDFVWKADKPSKGK